MKTSELIGLLSKGISTFGDLELEFVNVGPDFKLELIDNASKVQDKYRLNFWKSEECH